MEPKYAVKIQTLNMGRWEYLADRGSTTKKRKFAQVFSDKKCAQATADGIRNLNPGVDAKVVAI